MARSIHSIVAQLALVALWAAPAPLRADLWYDHYENAEAALAAEDWTRAVEEINEALERKGDSGRRVRTYGMRVTAYFPYLKLGVAYYHLGQLDAAQTALDTEQQLGEIHSAKDELAELERYRRRIRDARAETQAAQRRRIEEIVAASLEEAADLERLGRFEEAIEALGSCLAVDPENPAAGEAMARVTAELARRDQLRADAERAAGLVARGRELLAAESYSEASSVLAQALELDPTGPARTLREQAQAALRAELEEERNAAERRSLVSRGLAEARGLERDGRFPEALERLQGVLAVDPKNADALALQERLLRADRDRTRQEELEGLLAEAEAELRDGRFERALAAANRALARGNASALDVLRRSYAELNRRLLSAAGEPREGAPANLPPAISFADFRQELEDNSRAQVVEEPRFRLSGVVFDTSPVEIAFSDGTGRAIQWITSSQAMGVVVLTEFSLDQRLATAVTTFQLVATDDEGLSSRSEYTVLYRRPFYRVPAFQLIAGAVPLALVAAFFAVRERRRRRLVRRRFNPYIAGAPVVADDMFYGRHELVERILQTIHNNSMLLYGERRIGKTSLQHHLKKRLEALEDPAYDFYPVYVDLQGTPQERFFATLAEEIFDGLGPALGEGPEAASGRPSPQPLSQRERGSELSFPEPGADLAGDYGYRDLVGDLRRVLKALKKRSSRQVKLVLLIDEVDELNDYDPRINQKLRSLFMKSFAENLVAIVSGVRIKKDWEREASPWYNFFEEIEVKPFRPEDAVELITRPIRGVFQLDDGVALRIVELTDGKPYLIQKHCVALVNRLHEGRRRTATLADVEAVGRPQGA